MKQFIFCFICLRVMAGCTPGLRQLGKQDSIVAWNEDTVVNYRIAFFRDHRFLYTTEDTVQGQKVVVGYGGWYRYARDTMFLTFKGKKSPPMCGFLIHAYPAYFSQQFRDHRRFMYLRYRWELFARHGVRDYFIFR